MNTIYWLLVIAVLIAMTFAGWIRPTGLLGRTRAEEEQESQRDAVAKWLDNDGEQTK
ncbi:MAG: hypothetical protein ABI192_21575 [Bradyrhizobium sp.]